MPVSTGLPFFFFFLRNSTLDETDDFINFVFYGLESSMVSL